MSSIDCRHRQRAEKSEMMTFQSHRRTKREVQSLLVVDDQENEAETKKKKKKKKSTQE